MSNFDLSANPTFAAAAMIRILDSLYPGFQLVDCTFPRLEFYLHHNNTVALGLPGRFSTEKERLFYARFRQQGGYAPVLDDRSMLSYLRSNASSMNEPRYMVVMMSGRIYGPPVYLSEITHSDSAVIIEGLADGYKAKEELTMAGFESGLHVTFRNEHSAENYVLAVRGCLDSNFIEIAVEALKLIAVDIRVGAHSGKWGDLQVELPEEGGSPASMTVLPYRFIHDGSRRSEGGDSYSWIWVGAERSIRILLGCVPSHFRKVRVLVANATPASNLQRANLLLNGRVVPTRVETWDEGRGVVETDLSPVAGELVLGLAVPATAVLEGTSEVLSICIDRIELVV